MFMPRESATLWENRQLLAGPSTVDKKIKIKFISQKTNKADMVNRLIICQTK